MQLELCDETKSLQILKDTNPESFTMAWVTFGEKISKSQLQGPGSRSLIARRLSGSQVADIPSSLSVFPRSLYSPMNYVPTIACDIVSEMLRTDSTECTSDFVATPAAIQKTDVCRARPSCSHRGRKEKAGGDCDAMLSLSDRAKSQWYSAFCMVPGSRLRNVGKIRRSKVGMCCHSQPCGPGGQIGPT